MIVNVIGGIALVLAAIYFGGSFIMARNDKPTFKNECLALVALAVAAICFK